MLFTLFLLTASKALSYPEVRIDTLIDFSQQDSASLEKEVMILNKILSNDQFWKTIKSTEFFCTDMRILHHYRKRKAAYPRLKKDKHLYTAAEIHDLLWNGDDEIGDPKDGFIDLKLKSKALEPRKKGTIRHGTTNKNTLIITSHPETRINNKKTGVYACHLLHEYMHILGFKHKSNLPSKNTKNCGGVDVPLRIQKIAKKFVPNN